MHMLQNYIACDKLLLYSSKISCLKFVYQCLNIAVEQMRELLWNFTVLQYRGYVISADGKLWCLDKPKSEDIVIPRSIFTYIKLQIQYSRKSPRDIFNWTNCVYICFIIVIN